MKNRYITLGVKAVGIDEENMIIEHVINTKTLDRYNTVVLPRGANVENFLNKNPRVLWYHGLDDNNLLPIGNCIELTVTDEKISVKTQFNKNDPFAVKVFNSYKDGYLSSWSIGFLPADAGYVRYEAANREALNNQYGLDISEKQINDAGFWGIYLIHTWELLEYSAVPVPGNPDAVNEEIEKKLAGELCTRGLISETQKEVFRMIRGVDFRKAVAEKDYPKADEGMAWDGDAAKSRLQKWASSDDSGDKDKIDWGKYKEGFAWYDEANKENFGSYKLPHHDIIDGAIKTVWNGVSAAMAALNGARQELDIPDADREPVYNHLKKHYAQFEKEVPELKTIEPETNATPKVICESCKEEVALMKEPEVSMGVTKCPKCGVSLTQDGKAVKVAPKAEQKDERVDKVLAELTEIKTTLSGQEKLNKDLLSVLDVYTKRFDDVLKSIADLAKTTGEVKENKAVENEVKLLNSAVEKIIKSLAVDNLETIRQLSQNKKNGDVDVEGGFFGRFVKQNQKD